jgi:hypothetical protein
VDTIARYDTVVFAYVPGAHGTCARAPCFLSGSRYEAPTFPELKAAHVAVVAFGANVFPTHSAHDDDPRCVACVPGSHATHSYP